MTTLKVVLSLSIAMSATALFAQSVADAAKTKPAKKASHVITNDEIPSKPQEDPKEAPGAGSGGASEAASEKPAANSDSDAPPASPEVQELEKQLSDLNKNIAARQKRTDEYREKMNSETDDHRKEIEQEVLAAMEGDIQEMQKEGEALQKKIDDKKAAEKDKLNDTDKPKETAEPKDSGNQ